MASQTKPAAQITQDGFVERMVGVAKKLMDKGGKEETPWISGLFDYRVTPQSGSIASPLELMTQCTPREKCPPQLPMDCPREWCRTAKRVQMHKAYVENKIYTH